MGNVLRLTGTVRLEMGDYPGTYAALNEARTLFVAAGSRRGEGLALHSLSHTLYVDLETSSPRELLASRSPVSTADRAGGGQHRHGWDRTWQREREEGRGRAPGVNGLPADRRAAVHGRNVPWTSHRGVGA